MIWPYVYDNWIEYILQKVQCDAKKWTTLSNNYHVDVEEIL
jgi:hypothetical protein